MCVELLNYRLVKEFVIYINIAMNKIILQAYRLILCWRSSKNKVLLGYE